MKFSSAILFLLSSSVEAKLRGLQAASWKPGDFSDGTSVEHNGHTLFLSNGLKARPVADIESPVVADDGTELSATYHPNADGGECIPKSDGSGGYYYVSNSEIGEYPEDFAATSVRKEFSDLLIGGAYSLEFNANHEFVGYQQVLADTAGNCAGGKTPWNTWISCEERRTWGRCWQVDPSGEIEPKPTGVTPYGVASFGNWEAFAWDGEYGYVTNDDKPAEGVPAYRGAIVRFTPSDTAKECLAQKDDADKWCALESGTHQYLKLDPESGTFEWVDSLEESNPEVYAGSEGLHAEDGILTFVTIVDKLMFRLDLTESTYTQKSVPFSQEPDNIRILDGTLYLCTDGDHDPNDAVWGWDSKGAYRVFYEENHNYPAGVAFSPDAKMMYVSMFGEVTWQMWREDGLAFNDETAGINYEHGVGLDA